MTIRWLVRFIDGTRRLGLHTAFSLFAVCQLTHRLARRTFEVTQFEPGEA